MKATELIKQLEALIKEHGDKEVEIFDYESDITDGIQSVKHQPTEIFKGWGIPREKGAEGFILHTI